MINTILQSLLSTYFAIFDIFNYFNLEWRSNNHNEHTWSPTFNSLVVLKSFHPFPMFILGDPIFLPLVTHTFMCLTYVCLLHILIFVPILPPCFIRNCWGNSCNKLKMVLEMALASYQCGKINLYNEQTYTQNDRKNTPI
jgi:hypothetical protein